MSSRKVRALISELLGSFTIAAAVVGSGIMAQNMTDDLAVMLILNTIGTVFGLAVAIAIFSQVGVAHFNPIVTLWTFSRGKQTLVESLQLIVFQVLGFVAGVTVTNYTFGGDSFQQAVQVRAGTGLLIGEVIASAGLIFVLTAVTRSDVRGGPQVWVPIWIGAAMLFTSSTSFANPAFTFARSLTDSFAGIASSSVFGFIIAELIGLVVGGLLVMYVFQMKFKKPKLS
jgi:glycerol uptake facilitator-like aquaporin